MKKEYGTIKQTNIQQKQTKTKTPKKTKKIFIAFDSNLLLIDFLSFLCCQNGVKMSVSLISV